MKKIIVHNEKYDDEIEYEVEEISTEEIEMIKSQLLARGWDFSDCWSEVEK